MQCCDSSLKGYLRYLDSKGEKLKPVELHKFCVEIIKGVQYLHELEKPIVHRDLKSKNVCFTLFFQ